MEDNLIIEYVEQINKVAQHSPLLPAKPSESVSLLDDWEISSYEEDLDNLEETDDLFVEDGSMDFSESELFDFPSFKEEVVEIDDGESAPFRLPGSTTDYVDDQEEEVVEEVKETDWENDRDVGKFMDYISKQYPSGIPKHDGTSTLGCERAILYLENLNREISEALRQDVNDVLDEHMSTLERKRVNMVRDIITLKNHIKKLQKKHKSQKKGEETTETIKKEATTPRVQLVATPFERAIAGILINSVVSGGKPFEEVYAFLKQKYKFSDKDELSIMQLVMDMGYSIFKDRGTFGDEPGTDQAGKSGVEYIKNYFA